MTPRSGGLRRRSDEPLAAATASRPPIAHRPPPRLLQSPGLVGALGGTNGRGRRRMDSPSAPGPCRFPGRCRRRDLGSRCLGAAPFWRTGAHRSSLWQPRSPRAWARQPSARPRASGAAGSSDRDRRTLRPRPQSARSGVVGRFEITEACRSSHPQSRQDDPSPSIARQDGLVNESSSNHARGRYRLTFRSRLGAGLGRRVRGGYKDHGRHRMFGRADRGLLDCADPGSLGSIASRPWGSSFTLELRSVAEVVVP